MHDTLQCPGCKAELALPTLGKGQTVQCPRCRHTVDPARPFSTALQAHPPAALPALKTAALDDPLPTDLRTLLRPDPLPSDWLSYLAIAFIALSSLSFLAQVAVYAALDEPHADWQPIQRCAKVVDRVTFWLAAFAFLAWLYQASANLKTLKAFGASHQPETAVLSFFVPIINFYRPYLIVQEIWQGSDPHAIANKFAWFDVPASSTIRYWWTLFLTGQIISWLSAMSVDSKAWLACLSNLLMASAGIYLIVLIQRITARQHERWHRLYADV